MSTERLLREYVRILLAEDEGGGDHAGYTAHDIMMSAGSMSPYGMHYGSGDDLYKAFIKPFVDVVQTTAGKTKEMSVKTQTLLKVTFETIATTLVPVLKNDYKELFEKEHAAIEKIRNQYAEVYKSNWDAIFNTDVMSAAFFYNPTAFLTVAFARKSPEIAMNLISILSGGTLDKWLDKIRYKIHPHSGHGGGHGGEKEKKDRHGEIVSPFGQYKKGDKTHLPTGGPGYGMDYYESVMRESPDGGDLREKVAQLLASDKVKAKLQDSQVVLKMEQEAQKVVRGTLQGVLKHAQAVLTANSLQDLQHKTGAKFKGTEKLAQIPEQERKNAEQTLLAGAKKSMKEFYVQNLEGQVQEVIKGGVPENSQYVQDYKRVIAKIKGL